MSNFMMTKFKLEQKAGAENTLVLHIYDDVAPDSWNWWDGKVPSETSANHFREELAKHPNVQEIEVHINSMGGSVVEGYGIYAQLREHPAKKTVYVDGFACSIASIIALAGDEIIMFRNAMMCVHNMMDICYGNAKAMRKCADDLDKIMEGNRQIYLSRANDTLTEERLVEMLDAETWLTAAECKELGWCDRIAEEDADLTGIEGALAQRKDGLAAQVASFRAMAQLLQSMVQGPAQEAPPPADTSTGQGVPEVTPPDGNPGAEPTGDPQGDPENKVQRMLTSLFV